MRIVFRFKTGISIELALSLALGPKARLNKKFDIEACLTAN